MENHLQSLYGECGLIMLGSKLPAFAADWYNRYYNIVAYSEIITLWRWIALDGIIDSALIMFALGLAYGYLRNRHNPDWVIFNKILPSVSLFAIGCLLCGLWYLIWDQEFRHYPAPVRTEITEVNPDIHILESDKEYPRLDDIISDSQIAGKPLYIMLWSMGCSSMYYYMNILKKMKQEYGNDDLQYVYICGEVSSSKAQWLRSISSRDIEGYHMFLTRKQFHRLFIDELGISNGTPACILVGSDGSILDKELPRLSKRVPLAEQIGDKITFSNEVPEE